MVIKRSAAIATLLGIVLLFGGAVVGYTALVKHLTGNVFIDLLITILAAIAFLIGAFVTLVEVLARTSTIKNIAAFVLFLIILSYIASFLLSMSPQPTVLPATGYEFKTGITPPNEVSSLLMNNSTVVLYFTQNLCPPCEIMTPKMADMQSQYNGTDVIFKTCNFSDQTKPQYDIALNCGKTYGITETPTVIVIRSDGAVASFVSNDEHPVIDMNTVKSAIEDAQKWQLSSPTPTPIPMPTLSSPTPIPMPTDQIPPQTPGVPPKATPTASPIWSPPTPRWIPD